MNVRSAVIKVPSVVKSGPSEIAPMMRILRRAS